MASNSKNVSYCDLVNFKDSSLINPQQRKPQKRLSLQRKPQKQEVYEFSMNQSSLQQSAIMRIRYQRQRKEAQAISDILSQSSKNTPANFTFPKKKNKHKTVGSDLFDIESKGSNMKKDQQEMFDGLILYPHFVGLTDVVYSQVMGKDKKINPKLIHSWKQCLLPEDKQQIYGGNAPYTNSRIFALNQLEKGFSEIYGSGKKRCLRVGQQSLLMHHMQKYLQKCTKDVMKIARKDFDIIGDILKSAKLLQLEQLPLCMKQIELLWKVLATQWRYSGQLDSKNRLLESALINGRSNFLDLRKENAVTAFLLNSSNYVRNQK